MLQKRITALVLSNVSGNTPRDFSTVSGLSLRFYLMIQKSQLGFYLMLQESHLGFYLIYQESQLGFYLMFQKAELGFYLMFQKSKLGFYRNPHGLSQSDIAQRIKRESDIYMCSRRSRRGLVQEDKRMAFVYTHGLFIT